MALPSKPNLWVMNLHVQQSTTPEVKKVITRALEVLRDRFVGIWLGWARNVSRWQAQLPSDVRSVELHIGCPERWYELPFILFVAPFLLFVAHLLCSIFQRSKRDVSLILLFRCRSTNLEMPPRTVIAGLLLWRGVPPWTLLSRPPAEVPSTMKHGYFSVDVLRLWMTLGSCHMAFMFVVWIGGV